MTVIRTIQLPPAAKLNDIINFLNRYRWPYKIDHDQLIIHFADEFAAEMFFRVYNVQEITQPT